MVGIVMSTDDVGAAPRYELEGPIVSTMELARYLCVTRQTILNWRLVGYLPKPVRCDGVGTFWMKSTIDAWAMAGMPWTDDVSARKALKKRGEDGLNDFIAPQPDVMEVRTEAAVRLLDEFEQQLNEAERLVQGDEYFNLASLGGRFKELGKQVRSARRRLKRRKGR